MKEEINPFPLAEGHILGEGTGISGEILLGTELHRIHKDRNDDTPFLTLLAIAALGCGKSFGTTDQRGMPLMQGSHGWNKDDGGGRSPAPCHHGADQGGRFHPRLLGRRGDRGWSLHQLLLDRRGTGERFHMQDGNHQCQDKEESAKPYRELGQDRGRLGTEKIVSETTSKSGPETFTLRALHEDCEDHQETDNHKDGYKKRHEEPHSFLIKPEELPL